MTWSRSSTVGDVPPDPLGAALAASVTEVLAGALVTLVYSPASEGAPADLEPHSHATATATAPGPAGWRTTVTVRLDERVAPLVGSSSEPTSLAELVRVLPGAAVSALAQLPREAPSPLHPALRRALRDTLAAEILERYLVARLGCRPRPHLVAETIDFLVELSGTRVESHDLTHGVVIADVFADTPRLELVYPADVRAAKRAPLLFDGERSVLVVDPHGRARTELQRHRLERLVEGVEIHRGHGAELFERDSLVAWATTATGGLGFFLRTDGSVWAYVDGRPLLVRRGEHWTAFPLELTASIANMIGGGAVAGLVARAATMISAEPRGAILAVVDDPAQLEEAVSPKDRYDRRNEFDPGAMRPETRLHHLIDAGDIDEHTLVRLASLDGATVLDRDGRLLAYGAIVATDDSEHEGARTAAARTLSKTAAVVLKVSVDGDITVFRHGGVVTTLLGRPAAGPG